MPALRSVAALMLLLAAMLPARAGASEADAFTACDQAAAGAEGRWHLPSGLLAGIGAVESGRAAPDGRFTVAWPWSINFGGRGMFLPSKESAVATVRSLQAGGWRAIDVGCFQVDLFYHPEAFASLDDAFDPATNAEAAARILMEGRFRSASWESAVALYHSANPLLGAAYLRRVLSAWSSTKARAIPGAAPEAYVAILSASARLVQVIGPSDGTKAQAQNLPQLRGPQDANGVVQWSANARALPVVLAPEPPAAPQARPSRRAN